MQQLYCMPRYQSIAGKEPHGTLVLVPISQVVLALRFYYTVYYVGSAHKLHLHCIYPGGYFYHGCVYKADGVACVDSVF